MCGLVGCIIKGKGGFNHHQLDVFETLLFIDTLRGEDSTGVFGVNNLGNVGIAKDILDGQYFLKTDAWKEMRRGLFQEGFAVIGHNRKATRGTIIDKNAHPFWVEDKVVLVHNGSYNGSHKHLKDVDVDSEAIAHIIAENPDNVEKALKQINAAYALIWYDVHKKTISFIRNSERPLHYVETSDAYYFASEAKMLEFALGRHNITMKDKIYEFPEHNLNQWILNDDKGYDIQSKQLDCKYSFQLGNERWQQHFNGRGANHFPGNRHPYACGWAENDYGDLDTPVATKIENKNLPVLVETNKDPVTVPLKLVEVPKATPNTITQTGLGAKVPIMSWMRRFQLKDAKGMFTQFATGSKIKVMVDDFVDLNECDAVVTGKTLDTLGIPVIFKLSKETVDKLTSPHNLNIENAVFEVVVKNPGWKRVDTRELKDSEEAWGVFAINAESPRMIFDGNGAGHA